MTDPTGRVPGGAGPANTFHGPSAWQLGDRNVQHNHYHAGSPAPVAWPVAVGRIPERAGHFQDRSPAGALPDGRARRLVLTGTGGVGKTQLAAEYARGVQRSGAVDLLLWLPATARSAIVAGYAQAALRVRAADPGGADDMAREFLGWLGRTTRRWLVVLDDLVEPADLHGLWPPATEYGAVLVTTRRRESAVTGSVREAVLVEPFTAPEAVSYLRAALAAQGRREPEEQLADLAADLGRLPLALSQAAVYLLDEEIGCADYRRRLTGRTRKLAELLPDADGRPDDQTVSAAAAWDLSVERADRLRPAGLARPLLQLVSLLAPDGIPAQVLDAAPARRFLAAAAGRERVGPDEARQARRVLHRLNLLDDGPGEIRVHQLVQRTVREQLDEERLGSACRAAAEALSAVWPAVERDPALSRSLRTNTAALERHAAAALWQHGGHPVLYRAAGSLGRSGQAAAALQQFRRIAQSAAQHLGADHPDALVARGHFADWLGHAGRPGAAVKVLTALLPGLLRVLGPQDRRVLTAGHSLANWRGQAGAPAAAHAALKRLVAQWEPVLGPADRAVMALYRDLAHWRGEAADPQAAVAALGPLLTRQERLLGRIHPETLTTRHQLATWRGRAGDPPGAVAALLELVPDQQAVLGARDHAVLVARCNLAHYQGTAGDAAAAVAGLRAALADMAEVLGPRHPDTLRARRSLAAWLGAEVPGR